MSSQSRVTPTLVAAAAAAAAMVTMAGTVWLMSPATYEDDSSSEEFDANGKRKPRSSLLKGTRYSRRRRRRQKSRRVHWSDQDHSISSAAESTSDAQDASSSHSQAVSLSPSADAQENSSTSASEPQSSTTPLSPPSRSSDMQSDIPAISEGSPRSPIFSISSWSKSSSPLAEISRIQDSAANAIINSANGIGRKNPSKANAISSPPSSPSKRVPNGTSSDHWTNGHHYRSGQETIPYSRFIQYLKPLRPEAWSEPDTESFMVRGPNYMKDGKKLNSAKAAFPLLTVDLIQHIGEGPYYHPVCGHPRERVQQAIKREEEFGSAVKELPPFVFAVNLCLPSSSVSVTNNNGTRSTANQYYHQVSYFGVEDMDEIVNETTAFGKLMNKFIFGDDDSFRDKTFKLIPKIVKGNMLVRAAVGSKPAIIGKKVKQYYFRGDRYFEILVDIGSDSIADRIVKLALGYAKSLVTEICFVLEGTDSETLPERIFGGVTLKFIDFKAKDGDRRMLPLDYAL